MERDLVEKPMDELQGTALQYSCVTAASRGTLRKGEKRVCIFCDKTYAGGPSVIADHIMHPSGSKIAACVPKLEWLQRFNEVSAEMKRRKGPTPTGPTPGEQRTGALNATRAGQTAMDKFLKKPTIEEIEEQFMRVACKHNGAMALADCPEFRKLLAMCARAGHSVLEGVKVENPQLSVETRGQTYVITLCHRNKMTTKVLPALDQKLMDKVGPIVEKSAEMNGSSGGGDGWTDHCGRPMMNFVQHVPEGARFVECIDASGDTKDAKYQASFAVKCMRKSGGVHVYFVLWFDGACKPAFSHIEEEVPHVSCVVDAAHSMDLMGKNICSTKPTVTIKDVGSKPWGVTKFGNVRAAVWYAIKALYAQEKTRAMYRAITKSAPGTEYRKFCMTRFLSNVKMVRRYKANLRFMEQLLASSEFNTWLEGQPTKIKERWAKVKKIVHDDALNADIDLFLRVLEPVEKMVRLFDGMKGVYIGVAYEALLQYETMLSNPIEGLADADRVKILEVYKARWKYLHKPIYTAAMMLHQAFCRQKYDKSQRDELEAVFKKLSTPHAEYTPECTFGALMMEYTDFIDQVTLGVGLLNDDIAFEGKALDMPPQKWWRTYGYRFPNLQWVAIRVGSVKIGSSSCETDWSIRGWVGDGRFASRGVPLMNRMTRVYNSLILEEAIETLEYTTEDVYWDVDCALTEPGDVTIVTTSTASTDVTYLDIDNDVEEEEDLFGDPYKDLELDDDEPAVTPQGGARGEPAEEVDEEEVAPTRPKRRRRN